jgi:hypothetical protein
MPKRNVRVISWLGSLPAIGICTHCAKNFRVPLGAMTRITDAVENLQQQFNTHKCEHKDARLKSFTKTDRVN